MAYIEKEPIIEFITKGLNNPDKTKAFGHDAIEILTEIEYAPTADVVPKSEVDNWYQLYHSIKEELKQEKMYHRATENLCDRYCIESQHAKMQVAREIFEEIEKIIASHRITIGLVFDEANGADVAIGRIGKMISELKKKYSEGEE